MIGRAHVTEGAELIQRFDTDQDEAIIAGSHQDAQDDRRRLGRQV
jgi:hypothetical protein